MYPNPLLLPSQPWPRGFSLLFLTLASPPILGCAMVLREGGWGSSSMGGGEQDSAEVQRWLRDPRSPRPFPLRNKSRSSIFFFLHLHVHEFQSEAPIALLPASIYPVFTGGREGHMGARTSLGDMAPSSLFSAGPRLDKQTNPMSPKSLSVRMIGGVPPPSWQTTALHY